MINEEVIKRAAAENSAKCAQGTIGGAALGGYMQPQELIAKAGLRDRLQGQIYRADKESRRVEGLRELDYLLEKNPEVARILDLLDLIQG